MTDAKEPETPWWVKYAVGFGHWLKTQGPFAVILFALLGAFIYLSNKNDKLEIDSLKQESLDCKTQLKALILTIEELRKIISSKSEL